METKTLTIFFADILGFTSKTACHTREEIELLAREIHSLIQKHVGHHRGKLVKTMGDGFLLSFDSPTDAVKCGMEIQENIKKRNSVILDADCIINFRIGISTGEVSVDDKGDVFGDAVNIASRIEEFAEPRAVCISEATFLAMNRNELKAVFRDLGPVKFKGIQNAIRVFAVADESAGVSAASGPFTRRAVRYGVLTSTALLAAVTVAALLLFSRPESDHDPLISAPAVQEAVQPQAKEREPVDGTVTNFLGMTFVPVEAGSFLMGSPDTEAGRDNDETRREVSIVEKYYMQKTEVTVGQWRAFVSETGYKTEAETGGGTWFFSGSEWTKRPDVFWDSPGFSQSELHPVTCLSWNDVGFFVSWINQKDDRRYRLPTEEEWEHSCRAGSSAARFWGDLPEGACDHANVGDLSTRGLALSGSALHACDDGSQVTSPVATYRPNAFGLHDMLGNVWEWCAGEYEAQKGISPSESRIFRGGGWRDSPEQVRSANRRHNRASTRMNDLGFRLVMNP